MSFVCFGVFFVIGSFVVFLCWTHIVLFQIVKSKLNNKKSTLQATWLKKKTTRPNRSPDESFQTPGFFNPFGVIPFPFWKGVSQPEERYQEEVRPGR